MKRRFATIYAVICTLLLAAGFLAVFLFAWKSGVPATVQCLIGLFAGFILAPIVHELGHVVFAAAVKMDCVYVKFFCFKIFIKEGKKRLGFASPFAPDQTQVLPKSGGNMEKRTFTYAVGGLVFSGIFIVGIIASAILVQVLVKTNYVLWGILPYTGYLFLFNILPLEYPNGKTDVGVCVGIRKGGDVEKNMLAAMEIQGQLSEGKSFTEIEEAWYTDVPQLCEDEPMFSVMLDLRYRYYLEKQDMDKAAACLNRLVDIMDYMPLQEAEKVAAELVYMNALRGEMPEAEENSKACQTFLRSNTATAKRVLAAWSVAGGHVEHAKALLEQAEQCLCFERVAGVKKFEKILLTRIEL